MIEVLVRVSLSKKNEEAEFPRGSFLLDLESLMHVLNQRNLWNINIYILINIIYKLWIVTLDNVFYHKMLWNISFG